MKARVIHWVAAAILVLAAGATHAQVVTSNTMTKIIGDPLTIHVGSDGSFQIFNSNVPGSGQIYPSSCTNTADMGIFANIGGTLFAPDFHAHTCSTATSQLGTFTAWSTSGVGAVTGEGTSDSPFTVTYKLAAPSRGVSIGVTITYVNGQNYFRIRKRVIGSTSQTVNVYLGADIYLASSDQGIYTYTPELFAPGGHDCATPSTYNILLIPITTSNAYTASQYANVWRQIGLNELDNDATEAGCIDNGAAVEWKDVLRGGRTTTEISSAVSFGDIPPASAFQNFSVAVTPNTVAALPGQTLEFDVTTSHSGDATFATPVSLSLVDIPQDFTAALTDTTFPAPGDGHTKLRVTLGDDVYPTMYRGLTVRASGKTADDVDQAYAGVFSIEVLCDPPLILSLPSSQPQSQTVKKGDKVTLSVKAEHAGAAKYQWYRGFAPLVGSPIAGANTSSYKTDAINELQQYWVRVTNACGTADSQTATIIPVD